MAEGGTVTFACGGIIQLSQSIVVSNNTILNGNGHTVTIRGRSNWINGVFDVTRGATFTVVGLTMTDGAGFLVGNIYEGYSDEGGCIRNLGGTLNLVNCVLSNNVASGIGGAIYNAGSLGMTNCMLVANGALGNGAPGNNAPNYVGNPGFGGGIYSRTGVVNMVNCSLIANRAAGANLFIGDAPQSGTSGAGSGGGLYIESGDVYLSNVTFSGNSAMAGTIQGTGFLATGIGKGAAIYNGGALVLMDSLFQQNFVTNGVPSDGGAIFSTGSLSAFDSIFDRNLARGSNGRRSGSSRGQLWNGGGRGGALFNSGTTVLTGTTFTGNTARGGDQSENTAFFTGGPAGGGYGGGIFNSGILAITNSTLTRNLAQGGSFGGVSGFSGNGGGSGYGGGLCHAGISLVLVHGTLALNEGVGGTNYNLSTNGVAAGGGVCALTGSTVLQGSLLAYSVSGSNCFGAVLDGGFNLSSDGSCSFTNVGSLNNVDPLLGELANNGGPTPTMALLPGSPALDAADPVGVPVTDQRGAQRPQGLGGDIGAFEFAYSRIVRTSGSDWDLEFSAAPSQTYTLQASSDCSSWSDVQTNTASAAGVLVFRLEREIYPLHFFRTAAQ